MVFEQVKESLAEILSKDMDMIDMDTKLVDDLGVDSIDSVELIMAVEEVYDITIPEEDAMAMKTVGDVVEYIEDHIVED
ncbi:MAG: acyl carrier protein [Peptococcaceae bacterium]|nr:acyl carrier protein [Peptococcaceae bacterium]